MTVRRTLRLSVGNSCDDQAEDPTSAPKPDSYVMFTIQDQLSRVAQWVEKSFLCGRKVAGDRWVRRKQGH